MPTDFTLLAGEETLGSLYIPPPKVQFFHLLLAAFAIFPIINDEDLQRSKQTKFFREAGFANYKIITRSNS
jgi:hypothetical protein